MPDEPKPQPKAQRVQVVSPSGEFGTLPADMAEDALASGYRPATEEDARKAQLRKKYSGAGGAAKKALAVADDAFLNATTAIPAAIADVAGADEMASDLRNIRREWDEVIGPEGKLLGQALGVAASLPKAGGSALKGAFRALGTAERGVTAVGNVAARQAERRGVGAIGQAAIRSGAEGAAVGGVHALTEAALGNAELTGEAVAMDVMGGALLGAGLGAGVGKFGQLLGKGGTKLKGALLRRNKAAGRHLTDAEFGHATDAGAVIADEADASLFRRNVAAEQDRLGRELTEDELNETFRLTILDPSADGAAARQRVLVDGQKTRDDLVRGTVDDHTRKLKASEHFYDAFVTRGKHDVFGHLVDSERVLRHAPGLIDEKLGKLRSFLWDVERRVGEFGPKSGKAIRQVVEPQIDTLRRAVATGDAAKIRTATERMKRTLDTQAFNFTNSRTKFKGQERALGQRMRKEIADDWRDFLESGDVWGAAGPAQRDLNFGIAQALETNSIGRKLLAKSGRSEVDPMLPGWVAEPERHASFVDAITDPKADLTLKELRKQLNGERMAAMAALKHGKHLTPRQTRVALELRDSAEAMLRRLDDGQHTVAELNQAKRLADAEAREITVVGEFGGALKGAMRGAAGVVGLGRAADLAEGAGDLASAGGTIGKARKLYALQSISDRLDGRVLEGASKLFGKATSAAKFGIPRMGSLAWHTVGDHEATDHKRLDYERNAETLRASTDEVARSGMGEAMAPVAGTAPAATEAAKQTAQRAQEYLREALPAGAVPAALLSARPMPSNAELSKFARKLATAQDPLGSVFDAMDRGQLTRDHVETMRAIYPETYQQLVDVMLDKVGGLEAEGETLPYSDTLQLSKLLGVPTHGTLRPDVMMAVQQSYAMPDPEQAAQGPRAPNGQRIPDLAGAMQTGSEETASEKES